MTLRKRLRTLGLTLITSSVLLAGCGSDGSNGSDAFFNNPPTVLGPTPAAPVAVNDSYNSLGNALLKVTTTDGVLSNDTLNNGTISGFDAVSTSGGTVTLQADGSFNYQPPNNTTGITDTFTYTLTNDGGTSTATVSIALANLGRFVDNTATAGGDGTEAAPFTTIQAGIDASASGDAVFVKSSLTPYRENIVLANGVSVQGEGAGFSIDNGLAREIRASVILPQGDAPILQGSATMASNSALSGMQILPGANPAILAMNVSDISVTDNEIVGATNGLDLSEVGGTITVNGNRFVNILVYGISLLNSTTPANMTCNSNVFTNGSGVVSTEAIHAVCSQNPLNLSADGNTSTGDQLSGYNRFCNINCTNAGSEGSSLTLGNNNIFTIKEAVVSNNDLGGNYQLTGNEFQGGCTVFLRSSGIPTAVPFRCVIEGNVVMQPVGFAGTILETKPNGPSEITVRNNQLHLDGIALLGGQGTLIFSDNNVTSGPAVVFADDSSGTTLVACRNNITAGTLGVGCGSAVNVCAAVSGNSASTINVDELGTGELSVEGLNAPEGGPLSTLNNGATIDPSGSPTSVPVGSCGI